MRDNALLRKIFSSERVKVQAGGWRELNSNGISQSVLFSKYYYY
jgi:hypothetical protein